MSRPAVSVVMPFAGDRDAAHAAIGALQGLAARAGDELILADNSGVADRAAGVEVVRAGGEASAAHARNVGAGRATRDWILFLDADCEPAPDLLDAYFSAPVDARVGALAGIVVPASDQRSVAERYAAARNFLGQEVHLAHPYLPRAVAANLLVRRTAFEALGGFVEGVHAGEDTDFSWRLQQAGWLLEPRPARVSHRYRATVGELRRQWRAYAAGRAWLAQRYEGFTPEPALARVLRRRPRRGTAVPGGATGSPPSWRDRVLFLGLDVILGFEELVGLRMSNRARGALMRIHIVDPSAFTPPYDHALSAALARAGASVELITSEFAYGSVPAADGYVVRECFYRHARGAAGSRARRVSKLAEHVPDMLRYRRLAARAADVVHFQWLDVQWLDGWLLPPRPVVLTAHDLLPREARPGQASAQRRLYDRVDAVVAHSEYGRRQLVDGLGLDPAKVHVIHHGAFDHLTRVEVGELPVPPTTRPVALFFGLLRPYKGLDTLLEAWRGIEGAELWIVGRPMMDLEPLRARAPSSVQFVPRFVDDGELAALFDRADLVVLPYSRTERFDFSGVLATALAFGKPAVLSDIGGFAELAGTGAAMVVPPGNPRALHEALRDLLGDPVARAGLAAAARVAADGSYSWAVAADRTLALYGDLLQSAAQ